MTESSGLGRQQVATTFDFSHLEEHAIELDPRRLDAALPASA
jgi:hypothetical protein